MGNRMIPPDGDPFVAAGEARKANLGRLAELQDRLNHEFFTSEADEERMVLEDEVKRLRRSLRRRGDARLWAD